MFLLSFDTAKVQQFLDIGKFLIVFNLIYEFKPQQQNNQSLSLECVEAYSYPPMM